MKIRNGFVSNSSSSSFVIAVRVGDACTHCGRYDINILDIMASVRTHDESELLARGLDATIAWFRNFMGTSADDATTVLNTETACRTLITEGYEVGVICISYHDETLNYIFGTMCTSGTIKKLYGEG
jgi:hypothetical protein